MRGVYVRYLFRAGHEFDAVATAVTITEAPEALQLRCDDEAPIADMATDDAGAAKLLATLLQTNVE